MWHCMTQMRDKNMPISLCGLPVIMASVNISTMTFGGFFIFVLFNLHFLIQWQLDDQLSLIHLTRRDKQYHQDVIQTLLWKMASLQAKMSLRKNYHQWKRCILWLSIRSVLNAFVKMEIFEFSFKFLWRWFLIEFRSPCSWSSEHISKEILWRLRCMHLRIRSWKYRLKLTAILLCVGL